MNPFTEDVPIVLIKAMAQGDKKIRIALAAAILFIGIGVATYNLTRSEVWQILGWFIGGVGVFTALVVYALQKTKELKEQQEKIEIVEKKADDNPQQPQFAWEAARVKLESYLNRNLSQVRSIFLLTNIVMSAGFALIGIGAYQAFRNPQTFKASVLTSVSGVIVSFIGGTFLVLYKATMAQAKDYVTILERINAVGMSIQILGLLDERDRDLKHQTMANVASQLLQMYAGSVTRPPAGQRKRAAHGG